MTEFDNKRLELLKELEGIQGYLEEEIPDDPGIQVAELSRLNVLLARCNGIWVDAKCLYNSALKNAHEKYADAIGKMAPSVAIQFVKAACSDEENVVFLAERMDRTIVHVCDNLRTQISFAKEQMRLAGS